MAEATTGETLNPERMEGQEIAGCKIIEKIATGGMGTVYRALQVSMSRQVAIKCLAEEFSRDQQYVGRFVREARAAGELSHTNLIHVLDVGVHQGVYYYLMEYVDGQSVDRILKIKGQLGPETAVEIMIQAARALSYAHGHGIIHRDIKPDNLMITKEGTVKLADLGIAKKLDPSREATDAGLVLGTPNYMAPEQAQDASLTDKRSDIYALGSTAYHMLSGKPPYTGKSALEVLTNVIKRRPIPLEKVRADVPKGLLQIVNKMMMRDPERRHESMEALLKDLDLYKAGKLPVEKRPGATTWEDEEGDEPGAPKDALEFESAEESAKRSGIILPLPKPIPGAAGDSVKLSGTRVLPVGAPGASAQASDALSQKAIGAINSKPKSPLIPLLTLGGAIVLGIVGWFVMKNFTKPPPEIPKVTPKTDPSDFGTVEPAGESQAKEALAEAEKNEKAGGRSRLEILNPYESILKQWPDTPSGKLALAASERIQKEWQADFEAKLADTRTKLGKLKDGDSYKPVTDAFAKAKAAAAGKPEYVIKTNLLDREIVADGLKRSEAIGSKAREQGARKAWLEAIRIEKLVLAMELPAYEEIALSSISDWREKWRAERETALVQYHKILLEAQALTRGSPDLTKDEMRIDLALEKLQGARNDPALRAITDMIQFDIEMYKDGQQLMEDAWAQVDVLAKAGEMWKFSKDAWANNAPVKVLAAARPKVKVETQGRNANTKALVHEDMLALAGVVLDKNAAGRGRQAAYLFARGESRDARRRIENFQDKDSLARRARIDDLRIRVLESAPSNKPKDILNPGSGDWDVPKMKGQWVVKNNGEELYASGDPGEIVMARPPERDYILEMEVRRESGPNGLSVSFNAFGSPFLWTIGDNANTFSMVRGLPATRTNDILESGDPMLIRLTVYEDRVTGYINGERRWEFTKAMAGQPSPGPQMGLSVLHTVVRIRRLRLIELKDIK